MAEFQGKDEQYVADWLRREGFKPSVVTAFLGKFLKATKFLIQWSQAVLKIYYADNEVEGEAFLELTEEMIKTLIPAIGPRARFVKKHQAVLVRSLQIND